jgi:hypothetical protein
MPIEFTGAVAIGGGKLEVKQPLFLGFAAGNQDVMMRPAQLRQHC